MTKTANRTAHLDKLLMLRDAAQGRKGISTMFNMRSPFSPPRGEIKEFVGKARLLAGIRLRFQLRFRGKSDKVLA